MVMTTFWDSVLLMRSKMQRMVRERRGGGGVTTKMEEGRRSRMWRRRGGTVREGTWMGTRAREVRRRRKMRVTENRAQRGNGKGVRIAGEVTAVAVAAAGLWAPAAGL
jgi:hypothetical protein